MKVTTIFYFSTPVKFQALWVTEEALHVFPCKTIESVFMQEGENKAILLPVVLPTDGWKGGACSPSGYCP